MDYVNNSNIINTLNKNPSNINLDKINNNTNLVAPLEALKEKIRIREGELIGIMNKQKEEYEKTSQQRELEVSNLVDQLATENQELKKQILNLELEKQYYKETLDDYKKNNDFVFAEEENILNNNSITSNNGLLFSTSVNPTADRLFFQAIKYVNEIFENKQRELNEKYDLIYYNFLQEKAEQLNHIKSFDLEHFLTRNANIHNRAELEEHLIPIELLEEQFLIFENKIKLLFEELKNKENQSLIIENKYDLLMEENRAIKRKFNEEKKFLLIKITDIKTEHDKIHREIINKLEEEIREKKITLEKRINESLKVNEELINNLIREKNELNDSLREAEKKLWICSQELDYSEKERKNLEEFMNRTQVEIDQLKGDLESYMEECKTLKIENQLFNKAKEDLLGKLNETNFKINTLDAEKKTLEEKLSFKIKENEKLKHENEIFVKQQTSRLNMQIIENDRKITELESDRGKDNEKIDILGKKINNDNQLINKLNEELEKLKLVANESKLNNKNLTLQIDELAIAHEKAKNFKIQAETECSKKDETIKVLRETLANLEKQHNMSLFEIEKINKNKKDLAFENEQLLKTKNQIINQLDSLKVSYNAEIQKLKNEINELEKKISNKGEISIELSNQRLKQELNHIRKGLYELYYKYILNKENIHHIPNPLPNLDDEKIIAEISTALEKGLEAISEKVDEMTFTTVNNSAINRNAGSQDLSRLLSNNNTLRDKDKELKTLSEEMLRLNKEILAHKTKISELESQLENSKQENLYANNNYAKNVVNENIYYKGAEKGSKSSLYESLIIYLKNINLMHLMEVYQLNLQREEDIRKILESKGIPEKEQIKMEILKLSENFNILKANCENVIKEYQVRSKAYILYDELENKILEHKNFTENVLNLVLGKFFEKKDARKDFIFFKFEHAEYNQIIEDLTGDLEAFHKKEFLYLENYKRNLSNILPAIEVLSKQTILEGDKLNVLMNNPSYKLI